MKKKSQTKILKPERSKHSIEEFLGVVPMSSIENIMSQRELNKFTKFMAGQTIAWLPQQGGVYYNDLLRFLGNINDYTLYD